MAADLQFASEALDATGFARRHLAEKSLINRVAAVSDASDLQDGIVSAGAHVTRVFAEGSFRFTDIRKYAALDNDFRRGGHLEVNGQALDDLDRFPTDASRGCEFINPH